MNLDVSGDQIAGFEMLVTATQIGDYATGFLDQKRACGKIPLSQPQLPEGIGAACRQPGEIQRGGSGAAHSGGIFYQCLHHAEIGVYMLLVAVGNTGSQQGAVQILLPGNADAMVVQVGAATLVRAEGFIPQRVIDHGGFQLTAVLQGNGNGELWEAMQIVGGAV